MPVSEDISNAIKTALDAMSSSSAAYSHTLKQVERYDRKKMSTNGLRPVAWIENFSESWANADEEGEWRVSLTVRVLIQAEATAGKSSNEIEKEIGADVKKCILAISDDDSAVANVPEAMDDSVFGDDDLQLYFSIVTFRYSYNLDENLDLAVSVN